MRITHGGEILESVISETLKKAKSGLCRRLPPIPFFGKGYVMNQSAIVGDAYWCGEHERRDSNAKS